ncbi:Dabb family protein [Ulvibacterium sp.]|uniref:Dabb family protein n=1 Tax=Ulvibacterium sp. TaxID=2665914 RepID=UPI002636DE33|nr:Dabb family protein [Ulvibacterium sp.]
MNKKNGRAIQTEITMEQDSVLRHVVLFKFKEGTSQEKISEIEDAFAALPSKIPEIAGYEWGLNNSPEGLNKGLTHAFLLTFNSEADRAIYLPHPDHKAFGALLSPHLADVTVVDYWSKEN